MAIYYPHKQTIIIVVVCILAVGGTGYYAYGKKGFISSKQKPVVEVPLQDPSDTDTATDTTDSSTDWQKQFYSATTSKPALSGSTKSKPSTPDEKLTTTDQVGRTFFTNYVQLEQNNAINNQRSVNNAVESTIDTALQSVPELKTYTTADIRITTQNDTVTIRAYGNTVGDILEKNAPRGDAALIASEAFTNEDLSQLGGIDVIISGYQKTIRLLLATPAPSSVASLHLALINGLSAVLYVSQGLRAAETDPVQAMVALGTHKVAQESLLSALTGLKDHFEEEGIVFSDTEPGYAFTDTP
jgi:hypothetical protein